MNKNISDIFITNSVASGENLRLASFIYSVSKRYTYRSFVLSEKHIIEVLRCSKTVAAKVYKQVLKDPVNFPILKYKNNVPVVGIPSMKNENSLHFKVTNEPTSYFETKTLLKSLAIVAKISKHNFLSNTTKEIKYSAANENKRLKKKYVGMNVEEEIAYNTLATKINRSRPTAKRWVKKAIENKMLFKYCSPKVLLIQNCDHRTYHKIKEDDSTVFMMNGGLYRQLPNTYVVGTKCVYKGNTKSSTKKGNSLS